MRKWNGVKVTEVAFKEVVSHINVGARSSGGSWIPQDYVAWVYFIC